MREVGEGVEFETGRGRRWRKLAFEVEVVEMGRGEGWEEVVVRCDPVEHGGFRWCTEEEVRAMEKEIVTGEQFGVMMEGFEGRRRVSVRNEGGGVECQKRDS